MLPWIRHHHAAGPGGRTLAAATVVALGLGALAAACAPDPGARGGSGLPAPTEVQAALDGYGASGPAVAIWGWTPEFVAGEPGAEPLRPVVEWIAPTGPAGSPTGTVSVWRDPTRGGSLERAVVTDDARLAAALATLDPEDVLVTDRSDWLVVTADRVRPLLTPPRGDLTGPLSVAEYGRVLTARVAAGAPHDGPGGDSIGG